MLKNILALIGFLSALIGIFRFFYIEELPKIQGLYSPVPLRINSNTKFLDILDFVYENTGKLIFIDISIVFCNEYSKTKQKCPLPRISDNTGENKLRSISYYFHASTISDNFVDEKGNFKDISSSVTSGKALEKILDRFLTQQKMTTTGFSDLLFDNGTRITFHDDISNISPYSKVIFGIEGAEDVIYGVYSVKLSIVDAHYTFDIIPVAIDSNIMKRTECTLKDWNKIRKFFQCPFL